LDTGLPVFLPAWVGPGPCACALKLDRSDVTGGPELDAKGIQVWAEILGRVLDLAAAEMAADSRRRAAPPLRTPAADPPSSRTPVAGPPATATPRSEGSTNAREAELKRVRTELKAIKGSGIHLTAAKKAKVQNLEEREATLVEQLRSALHADRLRSVGEELRAAVWKDDLEAVRQLSAMGTHFVNAAAEVDSVTALITAAMYGRIEATRMLVDAGADLEAVDVFGRSALMLSAGNGYDEAVSLLIGAGAALDVTDTKKQWTAFMFAVSPPALEPRLSPCAVERRAIDSLR
jgi:hypothetical protein